MENTQTHKQPWLHSAITDGVFILSPPFIALLLVVCLPAQFQTNAAMPAYYWLFLVVFIDVAHVYSTLYRTYFIAGAYKHDAFLVTVPLACYIAGVLLYSYNGMLFWRILAYLAVFHFIRQQYGFMRLYSRYEDSPKWYRRIDNIAIYTATIYPLFYWHFAGGRNFSWFVEGDILTHPSPLLLVTGMVAYLAIIVIYVIKECMFVYRTQTFNLPRNLLITGTFLSWYFGIVYFNGDLAFTTLNVVSHGIPYMALIWVFEQKRYQQGKVKKSTILKLSFGHYGVIVFIVLLAALAYLEEGVWDGMVWREHGSVFSMFSALPRITGEQALTFLVPLLALPQSTHYVLDGFIWKIKNKD
ncbi:hypothetical protein [Mucilaginibacter pedocola]|uniref:Uncharacterized protein n=1 Tax=Mucilaginibacter pedocola TaxID=1792845 RepID=A0A1S9P9N7_9SPHI|nr:hypothetical protein [Mucilaginibacter pedocola]OOQ57547.1 hypothetical protein BC343_12120 [Mucilaginibacter pedocola]